MNLYAVIMAGGSGTRFWPLSRAGYPKQLLRLGSDRTPLDLTVERLLPIMPPESIYIVTGTELRGLTQMLVPIVPHGNIIAEPMQRNTAACVGLAAKMIAHKDPNAVLAVLPADHLIKKPAIFRDILSAAADQASVFGRLVTFGIKADYPETGYGYIEMGRVEEEIRGHAFKTAKAFREKPDLKTAKKFVASGHYAWNSGMFVFRADTILAEIATHLPELSEGLKKINPGKTQKKLAAEIATVYPTLPSVSIDHGVMEKAKDIRVVAADIDWSDVGSFLTLPTAYGSDADGHCVCGEGLSLEGKDNILASRDGFVVTLGVSDLIVVHTPDVTLVCPKDRAQDIKKITEILRTKGLEKYL